MEYSLLHRLVGIMEKIAAAGSSYETGRASDRMLDSLDLFFI
jgi:hypothetical protein